MTVLIKRNKKKGADATNPNSDLLKKECKYMAYDNSHLYSK